MGSQVITGLRQLFARGATFSGLLRYIVSQHPGERVTPATVREYLMDAFAIPFHEPIRMDVESPASDVLCAAVTAFLIPEIVSARPRWDGEPGSAEGARDWLDDLPVRDAGQVQEPSTATPHPGISAAGWAALSIAERERLAQMEAGNRLLWERVQVLARLAEQLQRRICELEDKLD
jgi:hypothetical protein